MTSGKQPRDIVAGFLPLVDAALLIAAKEQGFAEQEGITLNLVRETSWANIRDRVAVGHFQCAHMLAPMPIAARLGLTPMPADIIAPMALGLNGDAVTVSREVHSHLEQVGASGGLDARKAGLGLGIVVEGRARTGRPKLVFGVVHPHSAHNYALRYWLHASGIAPEQDIDIVIVPPPILPDALAAGRIDGYCVGEPWNSVAALRGDGVIVTSISAIWRSSPEKVLGVDASFAERHPQVVDAILRALYRAAVWCAAEENRDTLAVLLARPDYIGVTPEAILPALSGNVPLGTGHTVRDPDFYIPLARAATFPWKSQAAWFYSQMVRWGHAPWSEDNARHAVDVYRPDIYRRALAGLAVPLPSADSKVEGALKAARPFEAAGGELVLGPDDFFDGQIFLPEETRAYVALQMLPAL
jgi:ABC-type nitrate/sulfonate/bicarbonate transport system substrate-binding protein